MKKLSTLLLQRRAILDQARLANLAFAYQTLNDFAERIRRAGLRGRVEMKPINPDEERFCVALLALEGSQSVIEEHFSDEDLVLLADVIGFATAHPTHELAFHLEQFDDFIAPLRADLERAGVALDRPAAAVENADSCGGAA